MHVSGLTICTAITHVCSRLDILST